MDAGFPDKVLELSTMHTSYDGRYVNYGAFFLCIALMRDFVLQWLPPE